MQALQYERALSSHPLLVLDKVIPHHKSAVAELALASPHDTYHAPKLEALTVLLEVSQRLAEDVLSTFDSSSNMILECCTLTESAGSSSVRGDRILHSPRWPACQAAPAGVSLWLSLRPDAVTLTCCAGVRDHDIQRPARHGSGHPGYPPDHPWTQGGRVCPAAQTPRHCGDRSPHPGWCAAHAP